MRKGWCVNVHTSHNGQFECEAEEWARGGAEGADSDGDQNSQRGCGGG